MIPKAETSIVTSALLLTWIDIGSNVVPVMKLPPNGTLILPCLITRTFPFQPSPNESVSYIVNVTFPVGFVLELPTTATLTYVLIPQSLVLLIYPNPLSPQFVPHEFLINQWVELYPTNNTAWSIPAVVLHTIFPLAPG